MTKQTHKPRVLSGIRPTGSLHLGNYLGAIKGDLELQNDDRYETLYMVADLHGLTTPFSPEELAKSRREVIIDYLAAGLDPAKSVIFLQSMVPEHIELAYYFSTVMTVARMQHLPTFKDKVKQYPDHVTMALLNYPVLMAADILVYQASSVPVGIDQEPHIEVAREIARKMNDQYGLNFPEPRRFETPGAYVPSLTGVGKMSKSVPGSYIAMSDDLATIESRLRSVPTDSGQGSIGPTRVKEIKHYTDKSGQPSPGVACLLSLVELFEGLTQRHAYETQYEGEGLRYSQVKSQLAQAIYQELQPFQAKRQELVADQKYVDQVIRQGADRARTIAAHTVSLVKRRIGVA